MPLKLNYSPSKIHRPCLALIATKAHTLPTSNPFPSLSLSHAEPVSCLPGDPRLLIARCLEILIRLVLHGSLCSPIRDDQDDGGRQGRSPRGSHRIQASLGALGCQRYRLRFFFPFFPLCSSVLMGSLGLSRSFF